MIGISSALVLALMIQSSGVPQAAREGAEVKMPSLDELVITVVYDNVKPLEGFEDAWGFSCVIEGCGKTILFDTGGDGRILMHNLEKAGFAAEDIDIVFLSHEHGDHFGGMSALLEENGSAAVYLPESCSRELKEAIRGECSRMVEVEGPAQIIPGVYSTGDMKGPVREQSMAIEFAEGAVVITGCAHPGVDRIVERAAEVTGGGIIMVMGGFHLGGAARSRLEDIAYVFDEYGVESCGASHCTGEESIEYLKKKYGRRFVELGAGRVVRGRDLELRGRS